MALRSTAIRAAFVAILVASAGLVLIPAIEARGRIVETIPPASNTPCGTIVTADLELSSDIVCSGSGNALIINANNIEIELNGYSIIGPGAGLPFAGTGIVVIGVSGIEIEGPGKITNFRQGISIAASEDVEVEELTVAGNFVGIRVLGSKNVEIEENWIKDNIRDGIQIQSSPTMAISGLEIEENIIEGNMNGLNLLSPGGGSEIEENEITQNICGVKGTTEGYDFDENKIKSNGTNWCR